MKAAMRTVEVPQGPEEGRAAARKTTVVIRRLEPWSVLKFSLLFYFCMMLIVVFALIIVYWALAVVGVLDSIAHLLSTAGFGAPKTRFKFHPVCVLSRLLLMGVVVVIDSSFFEPLV